MIDGAEARPTPKYPEHEKLHAQRCPGAPDDPFAAHSHHVGEFIEWLLGQDYVIARWRPTTCLYCEKAWVPDPENPERCGACGLVWARSADELLPEHRRIESWLAMFYGLDEKRLEDEKRQMLDELREAHP